jgi:hypothetical protein
MDLAPVRTFERTHDEQRVVGLAVVNHSAMLKSHIFDAGQDSDHVAFV